MKFFIEGKEDMVNLVSSQLKSMGVKVPKVKKTKISIPKQQEKGPFQSKLKVFGVRLDAQDVASNYSHLPKFILSCTDYLQKHSKEVGLFRKAGSVARQKNLRIKIENGGSFEGSDPNDAASLMKQWLRELPEPLIPSYLHDSLIRCQSLNNDESRIMSTLLVCLFLPPGHLHTLKHLMHFLAEIATDREKNRMGAHNLALIMAPNIFAIGTNFIDKSCNAKVQQFSSVIQLLIENADKIGELPPTILSKFETLEKTHQSELNSPIDVECSPSMSRKQYLLRSLKKLVKQNSTPPIIQTASPDKSNAQSLRQPTAEKNVKEIKAIASGTKGNSSLFATCSSEDICKRSFGLLRKKEKRLKVSSESSPITQSLEIEHSLDFPVEMDQANVDCTIQKPLLEKELNVGPMNTQVNHYNEKVQKLEDIEMTTFKMHVIDQNENLQAFPIPSFSSSLFQPQTEILFQNLETEKFGQMQEVHSVQLNEINNTKLLQHVDEQKLVTITTSTSILDSVSNSNKDSYCLKTPKQVQISCSPKTLQLFTGESQNTCQTEISPKKINFSKMTDLINCNQIEYSSVINTRKNNSKIKDSTNVDSKCLQSIDTELLSKDSSRENLRLFQMKIREDTFIIEPKQKVSLENEMEILDGKQMYKTVFNYPCIEINLHNKAEQKKQYLASNTKSKLNKQNKKVVKKSNKSVKVNCKNRPTSREPTVQKTINSTYSVNLNKNQEDTKLFEDAASSNNLDFEKVNFPIFTSKDNLCNNNHSISPSIRNSNEFSSSFEMGQRPKRKSTSMCSSSPSKISSSKIPRLNSFDKSRANSSETATNHSQKVFKTRNSKEADSCGHSTRIPVKSDNSKSNLSTLQLSINDSCFLTPSKNAVLSPNSVVWMSGNKYFGFSSPEEQERFNKRESIAMILESNPGHVQAKVHLYDVLVRKSEYSTENGPCHSTPASKFSKRLSTSSQSLKSSSKPRTKLQSSNSISYSKKTLVSRSSSVQNAAKSQKRTCNAQLSLPSPIKSYSLKDVTNKCFLLNPSKNSKNVLVKSDNVSIFLDENIKDSTEINRKLKRNSFSGNNSKKLPKKVSRSESTPGPRLHRRVSCLIQESNFTK